MFQREPKKWRTQELSLAPLFQSILVKMRLISKALYPFYLNFLQISLQRNKEIVKYKKQVLKKGKLNKQNRGFC